MLRALCSASFARVTDVRRGFARAVSKRWAEDGVVVPNSAKWKVFVTSTADNLDEPRCFEYHGTAITVISHVSHDTDSMRENHPPLSLDVLEETAIQVPDDCAVVPYIDEDAGEITLSSVDVRSVRSPFAQNP